MNTTYRQTSNKTSVIYSTHNYSSSNVVDHDPMWGDNKIKRNAKKLNKNEDLDEFIDFKKKYVKRRQSKVLRNIYNSTDFNNMSPSKMS